MVLWNKKRLKFIKNGGKDCFQAGTKLLFKDEDNTELEFIVVINRKGNYNALLMTNYSDMFELMTEYYICSYNCAYSDTLVEALENDLDLTFIKVINK